MELRLAFGPGTRLWAYRSREDLCYDWLHFKERRANASFREFALGALHCKRKSRPFTVRTCVRSRRRVATILKAYRVKKRRRNVPASTIPPQSNGSPMSHARSRPANAFAGSMPVAQALFPERTVIARPPLERERGGSLNLAQTSHLRHGQDTRLSSEDSSRHERAPADPRRQRDRIVERSSRTCGP